jgi:OOP family OmpA-OmpF porin
MKKAFICFLLLILFVISSQFSFAQDDADGCKDHPLVNRMPGFYLALCDESYNEKELIAGVEKTEIVEGTVTEYEYYAKDGQKLPSRFQVIKNYENAILQNGGEKIYLKARESGEGPQAATFRMKTADAIYWLSLYYFNGSDAQCDGYRMVVVKVEGMKQEITANEMFEKVNAGEALALYINFDTGKSTIKEESQGIVEELYAMMNNNATLKIVIEGHTDNVGSAASNKTLSEQRAAAVKNALVKKGIAADRIKTLGYGQEKPLADNSTEDGKAKNRRVEIRKQ